MRLGVVTEQVGDGVYVVAPTGELDLYTCPEFKEELLRHLVERPPRRRRPVADDVRGLDRARSFASR